MYYCITKHFGFPAPRFKSVKLSQLFSRLGKYVKKLSNWVRKFRKEIVLLKLGSFWHAGNRRVYQNWIKVEKLSYTSRKMKVAKRLSWNLSTFPITAKQWTALLRCWWWRDRKEELLPHLRLTHSAFACWWHVNIFVFFQRIKFPLRFHHTFLLLRYNACIVILKRQCQGWRTT